MGKLRKKLTLNKETLRDLTAQNTGDVRGGPDATMTCGGTCGCSWGCHYTKGKPCHYTKGKPCH